MMFGLLMKKRRRHPIYFSVARCSDDQQFESARGKELSHESHIFITFV